MSETLDPKGGKEPPFVVFDCNLFLQAVGKGGNHAWRCLQLAIQGELLICMSEAVLAEIDGVLRRTEVRDLFPMLDDLRVEALIDWLREFAVFFEPVPTYLITQPIRKTSPTLTWRLLPGRSIS